MRLRIDAARGTDGTVNPRATLAGSGRAARQHFWQSAVDGSAGMPRSDIGFVIGEVQSGIEAVAAAVADGETARYVDDAAFAGNDIAVTITASKRTRKRVIAFWLRLSSLQRQQQQG